MVTTLQSCVGDDHVMRTAGLQLSVAMTLSCVAAITTCRKGDDSVMRTYGDLQLCVRDDHVMRGR